MVIGMNVKTIIIAICALSISNQVQANQANVNHERAAELTHIVKQDCGSCHGMTLKGGLGVAILPADLEGKSVEYLTFVIINGRENTAMPPWKEILTPKEAKWIAEQLKEGSFQ